MASSGSFTTNACEGRSLTFAWSIQSRSVANNTTTISWSLKGSGSYSGYVMGGPFTVVINGSTVYSSSNRIEVWAGNTKTTTVASGTTTIGHNADGTKSFSASVSAAIYSFSVNCSGSGSWALTTIPRASSISFLTSSVDVGTSVTVNIARNNDTFKHTVEFYINNSHTTVLNNIGLTASYKIPESWLNAMPSSTSCTAYCRITTYSGNTQIGSAVSKPFTITVPNNIVPTVGTITLDPANINSQNILVQGKNKLTVGVSGCSAGTGSSIKSYTFSGPGISSTTTNTSVTSSKTISNTGTLTYTVTVTDTRGRTASKSAIITCYAWSAPSITLSAYRVASSTSTTENDNGTFVRCAYNLAYSSVNNTNDVTVKIHYKKNSVNSYTSVTVLDNKTNKSGSYTLSNIDVNSTYTVYATVTDNYSGTSSSSQITIFGASRILNITKDGTGIAFGKMAESNNLLESKWPAKINGTLTVGSSTQSSAPTSGIHIHDVRNATITPDSFGDKNVNFYFDDINSWKSVIHMKGWAGAYAAWELAGNASSNISSPYDNLYYRQGIGDTWEDWRTVLDSSNYTNWVSPKPTTLYSSTGNNGTVTIQNAANFSYLEIYYMDDYSNGLSCTRVYNPNGKIVDLHVIEPSVSTKTTYIRRTRYTISGTTITPNVTSSGYVHISDTTILGTYTGTNKIKIYRVLGYK